MTESGEQDGVVVRQPAPERGWRRRVLDRVIGESGSDAVKSGLRNAAAAIDRGFTTRGRLNARHLRQFKDVHAGERCVIVGNGPSLKRTDLSLLKDVHTFGLNRLYLIFDELGFATEYHVVSNQLVVEQCAEDFRAIASPLFTTTPNRRFLDGASNTGYLTPLVGEDFSTDIVRGVWEGATVTYVAMQLAYYMGFTQVVLVGVDHRFAVSGPANATVESTGGDASHFDPNYFGKGFKWQLPDLEGSERVYRRAYAAFEADGRSIVDATVDGALEIFPKQQLRDALA